MKKLLFLLYISFFSIPAFAQIDSTKKTIDHETIIDSFLKELADENRAVDIILSQYITVEEPSSEIYDYLEVSLEGVRINLISKKLDEIKYIPYNKMPSKDIRDIDTEALDTNAIYFLMYKNRQMLAIYLENNKIGSFTLVSKGNGKAHFVLY